MASAWRRAPARGNRLSNWLLRTGLSEGITPADDVVNMRRSALVDREAERRVLDDLIDKAGQRGGALVVCGEAGLGKTALLGEASARAKERGRTVLTTAGFQAEAHLPFAGLHHLLGPLLAGVDQLPTPQRVALQAAFGLTDSAAPEFFLIALAALELLADAAADRPLLLVAEDAHWLDGETCDVLAFVARRLGSEPIVLLMSLREGYESPLAAPDLPMLQLRALDEAAAIALLDRAGQQFNLAVRRRVLEQAAGNPLALLELAATLGAERSGRLASAPGGVPLTERLERAFATRASELPAATRRLLLVAALADNSSLAEIIDATAALHGGGPPLDTLEPAVSAGLIDVDVTELRFRHPLVRAAIAQAAGVAERHAAHAALADVLVDQPDRQVWHRAAAAVGPDETTAAALEAVAARAERRGAIAAAVAALERAARLSSDAPPTACRSRRLRRARKRPLG